MHWLRPTESTSNLIPPHRDRPAIIQDNVISGGQLFGVINGLLEH
jgi:hypothetical protein